MMDWLNALTDAEFERVCLMSDRRRTNGLCGGNGLADNGRKLMDWCLKRDWLDALRAWEHRTVGPVWVLANIGGYTYLGHAPFDADTAWNIGVAWLARGEDLNATADWIEDEIRARL